MKLLLVDDDKIAVEIVKDLIDWKKYGITDIYEAYSAKTAKEILLEKQIDILISDIEMPKENGIELVKWTIENEVPVITFFLTSYPNFGYASLAIKYGVMDYLLKPIEKEILEMCIGKAVQVIEERKESEENEKMARLWKNKFVQAYEADAKEGTGESENTIHIVMDYIDKNFAEDISRNQLAKIACVHPDYLSHLFKEETGYTITGYLAKVRIAHAKQMLEKSSDSASEIAWKVGYSNSAYFSKIFNQMEGMSPTEYRKRVRGKAQ